MPRSVTGREVGAEVGYRAATRLPATPLRRALVWIAQDKQAEGFRGLELLTLPYTELVAGPGPAAPIVLTPGNSTA